MGLAALLTASSIYLVVVGLATLLFPTTVTAGALDPASLVLTDILRSMAGACLGGGIVNWMARNSEVSRLRDAIILGNTLGFAFAALFGIVAVLHGYGTYGWILVALNALFANSFLIVGLSNLSEPVI